MSDKIEADAGRNWMVVGGILAAITVGLAFVAWTWLSAGSGEQLTSSVAVSGKGQGTETRESEHYQKVLKDYNQGNAAQAGSTGDTYVSVFSTREQPVVQALPAQPAQQPPVAQPQQAGGNGGAQQPPAADQPLSEREQQRRQQINEQISAMLANWSAAPHGASSVAESYAGYAQSVNAPITGGEGSAVGQGGSNTKPEIPAVKVLPDYVRLAGLLETNIDTDENSDVIAFVPSGPYKGLKVYAPGYKRINKTVDMTFNAMVWRGKTYNITAKAVDKDSLRTSLSGEVNNRYFERIILPAIAAGIGSAGQLYEQSSSETVVTPEGGVIQTYPETPNSTAVIGSVIGGAGEQAGKVLAADAALIPTKQVLIPSMTTIGIQFIGPVLSSDEIAPGSKPDYPREGLTSAVSDIPKGAAAALQ